MKLKNKIIIAGLIHLGVISVNASSMESITHINQTLKKLTTVTEKIQALNEGKALQNFYNQVSKKTEQKVLEVAGNSIQYPLELKQEYDESASQLVGLIEKVINTKNNQGKSEDCKNKLSALEDPFLKIKQLVEEGVGYSVSQPVSRAKAFLSVNQSTALSLMASQVGMLQMMTCR